MGHGHFLASRREPGVDLVSLVEQQPQLSSSSHRNETAFTARLLMPKIAPKKARLMRTKKIILKIMGARKGEAKHADGEHDGIRRCAYRRGGQGMSNIIGS